MGFAYMIVAIHPVLETKTFSGNSILKWVSYSHSKCRDHSSSAAFIPNKSVSKGTKIFKNLADFSVCPKDLVGVQAAQKLWSLNLKCKYLTHLELPKCFFFSSTGGRATSF